MSSEKEQLRKQEAEADMPEANEEISQDAEAIKDKVGELVKDPEFRETLDAEALRGYEAFAKGEGEEMDVKQMASTLAYMQKQFKDVKEVKKRMSEGISKAIQGKVMTEKDRQFYQKKIHENVLNGNQNVTKEIMEKAEKELADSLKKREAERKEYDTIAHNPMVKNGVLAISATEKIQIPDEKSYLAMSVPNRRKFLDKVRNSLQSAKKHSEKQGGIEAEMMNAEYATLLAKAKKDKWIGTKTEKAAMDSFRKLDNHGKTEWIRDMKNGAHLQRFKDLWTEIRDTLKGEDLAKMEKNRETMGYKDLMAEFEKMKEQDSLRLGKEYDGKLEDAFAQRLISKHTKGAFQKDFKTQDLADKRDYLSQFDMQMARYKTLRGRIDSMKDKKSQETLNGMYESDKYGYTEINEAFEKFAGGKEKSADAAQLRDVTDISVKRGIIQANEMLKEQGKEKQGKFLTMLRKMTGGKLSENFNGSDFQNNLHNLREKGKEKRVEEQKTEVQPVNSKPDSISSLQDMMRKRRQQAEMTENQNADTQNQKTDREESKPQEIRGQENPLPRILDKNEIREQVDSEELRQDAKVTKEEGFTQVETTDKENRSVRTAIVEINREKSMKGLDKANQQREFRGERDGGNDKLSFSVKTESGKTIELTLQQIKAMERLIQGDLEDEKKAA